MRLPWRSTERRSGSGGGSYTDALVRAIQSTAGGATTAIPQATGAVETVAGIVGRGFAAAVVENGGPAAIALTPSWLAMAGRALIRRGEMAAAIKVGGGSVSLLPAQEIDVSGGPDPASWRYSLTLGGPSSTETLKLEPGAVIHLRYAVDPEQPWRGVGPFQSAELAATLGARLLAALADEAKVPVAYLLPTPKDGDDESMDQLRTDIANAKGDALLVEDMGDAWGGGGSPGTTASWLVRRLGMSPPETTVMLQEVASREILAAGGVLPGLFSAGAQSAAIREGWRMVGFGLIEPLARIVEEELRTKLDAPELKLDFSALRIGDVAGRARAFKAMVDAGVAPDEAMRLSGLTDDV